MTAQEGLKQFFGYDSFRDNQEDIVNAIISGKDTFVTLTTGAGKSICFQLPALMSDGVTIVISPLISLIKDQVEQLGRSGIKAAALHSNLTFKESIEVTNDIKANKYKIIYVSPERLQTNKFIDIVKLIDVKLIIIDEAHCISSWGATFRPAYSEIPDFIAELPNKPTVAAFTATAGEQSAMDIISSLNLENPFRVTSSIVRPNLNLLIHHDKGNKFVNILEYLKRHKNDTGVIYCSTRSGCEKLTDFLRKQKYDAIYYHAGMDAKARTKAQNDYMNGYHKIIVATNAFGMGVNKDNVRFVIHNDAPLSVENYYQEVGRAGRDGKESDCVLFVRADGLLFNRELVSNPKNMTSAADIAKLNDLEHFLFTDKDRCYVDALKEYFGEDVSVPYKCGKCTHCKPATTPHQIYEGNYKK